MLCGFSAISCTVALVSSISAFSVIRSSDFRKRSARARLEASVGIAILAPSGIAFSSFTELEYRPMPAVGTEMTLPISNLLSAANFSRYTVCCIRLASISPLPSA
ncbi:hypothetical protein D3C81_1845900 [compost metagenome]